MVLGHSPSSGRFRHTDMECPGVCHGRGGEGTDRHNCELSWRAEWAFRLSRRRRKISYRQAMIKEDFTGGGNSLSNSSGKVKGTLVNGAWRVQGRDCGGGGLED